MGKVLTFTLLMFVLLSCNQTPEKKVNEQSLKIYFTSKIKEVDSTMTLEELKFIKLDTTTLKNQYINLWNGMYDKTEEYSYELDRLIEKIKTNRKLQSLSSDLSYSLWKNYKDDADDDTKEAKEYILKDSLLRVDMAKIDTLLLTADSIKPVSYVAKCTYTIRKKDQSISKDTTRIRLDLDFNILDNNEYAKQLNRLYKPVSDYIVE
jgi:hypothetical protein